MRKFLAVIATAAAAGCASSPQSDSEIYDPFEGVNRVSFRVNNAVDGAVIEPLAKGYRFITPKPARDGIRNALANLNTPVIFANDVLQAEPARASDTLFRFLINSTVGIGGLFDVAERVGLERHSEDFGQTLGVWGVPEGPYVVLPLFGPGNTRDGIGRGVDTVFNPLTWLEFQDNNLDVILNFSITGLTLISAREQFLEQFDALRSQPEPYIALRRAYTLQRRAAIRNGREDESDPFDDLPDFDDEGFDDFDAFDETGDATDDTSTGGDN